MIHDCGWSLSGGHLTLAFHEKSRIVTSWSLIGGELNAFFSEVWFSFPCFLLVCSVSSGLVISPPVSFGPNALVPSSPTEQEQAKGNLFLHTVCGHVSLC